jgi:7-carboxy-7-deazaguanine synthase
VFPFITELCDRGYEVLIETGGYVSTDEVDPRASIILDVKCPASGERNEITGRIFDACAAMKTK